MGELEGDFRVFWVVDWGVVKLVVWVRLGEELRVICREFGALVWVEEKRRKVADLWQRKGAISGFSPAGDCTGRGVEVLGSLRDLLSSLSLEVLLGFCSTGSGAIECRNGGGRRLCMCTAEEGGARRSGMSRGRAGGQGQQVRTMRCRSVKAAVAEKGKNQRRRKRERKKEGGGREFLWAGPPC